MKRRQRNLVLPPGKRGFLPGKNGSGKSTSARIIASFWTAYRWSWTKAGWVRTNWGQSYPAVVIDTKPTGVWLGWAERMATQPGDVIDLLDEDIRRILYRPGYEDSRPWALDDLLNQIYLRGKPVLIVIDELTHVVDNADPDEGLHNCLTRGREFGISMLLCTQRAARIPLICYYESEFYYIHRIRGFEDKKRLQQHLGYAIPEMPRYRFLFYCDDDDQPPVAWGFRIKGQARAA